jgi:hypothetical protein
VLSPARRHEFHQESGRNQILLLPTAVTLELAGTRIQGLCPASFSANTFLKDASQGGSSRANVDLSLAFESREFMGRRAAVGYSDVAIGTTLAKLASPCTGA